MAPIYVTIFLVLLTQNKCDQESREHEEDVHSQVSGCEYFKHLVKKIAFSIFWEEIAPVKVERQGIVMNQKDPKHCQESHAIKRGQSRRLSLEH